MTIKTSVVFSELPSFCLMVHHHKPGVSCGKIVLLWSFKVTTKVYSACYSCICVPTMFVTVNHGPPFAWPDQSLCIWPVRCCEGHWGQGGQRSLPVQFAHVWLLPWWPQGQPGDAGDLPEWEGPVLGLHAGLQRCLLRFGSFCFLD